eukprot:UN02926
MILFQLTNPEYFQQQQNNNSNSPIANSLLNPPTGVLFAGPPGTGKTLTARAIAADSGLSFINCSISSLLSKYYGESEKLIAATFSLAHKFSPCVIFCDEFDQFVPNRANGQLRRTRRSFAVSDR